MSWSSEFEPDSGNNSKRGRSLSFPEQERPSNKNPRSSKDLATDTLRLTTPEHQTRSGPSPLLVAITAVLATVALVSGLLYFRGASEDATESASNASSSQAPGAEGNEATTLDGLIGGFDTTRVAFQPGTTSLTAEGSEALNRIRSAVANDPGATVAFDIRTYSEDSPAENHQLSIEQAEAVVDFFVEQDSIDKSQISARGLGSAAIDAGGSLSHFVTISLPDATRTVQNSFAETSGFAFASDPGAWPVETPPDSALQTIISLVAEEQTEVEIVVNTFDEPSVDSSADQEPAADGPTLNGLSTNLFTFEANGAQISDSIQQLLIDSGVDPSMISATNRTGEVEVPRGVNNVVSVVAGQQAQLVQNIAELDEIRFLPGEADLIGGSERSLDEAAAMLTGSAETLIINVHTFSQQTAEENQALSTSQAQAAVDYLVSQGVPETRLRAVGSGNSNQFDESERWTHTVLTIAQ